MHFSYSFLTVPQESDFDDDNRSASNECNHNGPILSSESADSHPDADCKCVRVHTPTNDCNTKLMDYPATNVHIYT